VSSAGSPLASRASRRSCSTFNSSRKAIAPAHRRLPLGPIAPAPAPTPAAAPAASSARVGSEAPTGTGTAVPPPGRAAPPSLLRPSEMESAGSLVARNASRPAAAPAEGANAVPTTPTLEMPMPCGRDASSGSSIAIATPSRSSAPQRGSPSSSASAAVRPAASAPGRMVPPRTKAGPRAPRGAASRCALASTRSGASNDSANVANTAAASSSCGRTDRVGRSACARARGRRAHGGGLRGTAQ
jgi:hypothetical protein